MSIERIIYKSETSDKAARNTNKKIAELCKAAIKENGFVEVWSKKNNNMISKIKNKEEIYAYWGSIEFSLDEPIPDSCTSKDGFVIEFVKGMTYNNKKEKVEIMDKILV